MVVTLGNSIEGKHDELNTVSEMVQFTFWPKMKLCEMDSREIGMSSIDNLKKSNKYLSAVIALILLPFSIYYIYRKRFDKTYLILLIR